LNEVSCAMTRFLVERALERGLQPQRLVEGLPVSVEEIVEGDRVSWDVFSQILEQLERLVGGPEGLEEIGEYHYRSRALELFGRVTRLVVRPRDLYWAGTLWFGNTMFRNVESKLEDLPDGRIRETLVIPEPHRDSPSFFRIVVGALRTGPEALGLAESLVHLELSPRQGVFTITPPPTLRFWGTLRRRVMAAISLSAALEELALQQQQIRTSYEELRVLHRRIEAQAALLERQVERRTQALQCANERLRREIRERERGSRELEESRSRLAASERLAAIGTLAAGIAHEINNPVASILATAERALELPANADGEVIERTLSDIVEAAKRCGRVVRSVLRFSRGEPMEKAPEDVNNVVRRAAQLMEHLVHDRSATLELQLAPEPLSAQINPLQIEQALINLLSNAFECKAGARVVLRTWRAGETVCVCVSDDGPGLGPEQRKRMFDPFYSTRPQGVGLGLSIVHGVVREHTGDISVESTPGRGTSITLELPATAD
jgi:signal transduction histidine kinase